MLPCVWQSPDILSSSTFLIPFTTIKMAKSDSKKVTPKVSKKEAAPKESSKKASKKEAPKEAPKPAPVPVKVSHVVTSLSSPRSSFSLLGGQGIQEVEEVQEGAYPSSRRVLRIRVFGRGVER